MSQQDPTADYRKYPKSPSFATVVVLACVTLVVVILLALLVLHRRANKMLPHGPNPTPNALALPGGAGSQRTLAC